MEAERPPCFEDVAIDERCLHCVDLRALAQYHKAYVVWWNLYEAWARDKTVSYAAAADAWDEVEKAEAALSDRVRRMLEE